MDIKRVVAGASIIGVIAFPAALLGAGAAGADPDRGDQEQRSDESAPRWEIPPNIAEEIAKNVSNLPSPIEANATFPVNVPLPGVGVNLVPPIVVNPPAPGAPNIDPLNPLGLPPAPAINPLNPLGLPPPPPPPPAINPLNPLGLPPPPDPFNPLGLPRLW